MAKRVKHVQTPDMVAHLWAHQSQDSARTSSGRVYFEGDTIYSYGLHFPIARHVTRKGKSAVLLTTRTYSVSTSGHCHMVERACSHLTTFHVEYPTPNFPREQFDGYRKRFVELSCKYAKARQHKPWFLNSLRALVQEANAFAQFFGLRARLNLAADLSVMEAECKAVEKREQASRQRKARKAERIRQERATQAAEALEVWVNGGPVDRRSFCDLPPRLRINGDMLETSRGAEVPLTHAVKAFKVIKRLHDKRQAYHRNGHTIHLGQFALDAIDTQGNVTAGCHNVAWEEIERVAALAGVN